jgi:hypothetical protein
MSPHLHRIVSKDANDRMSDAPKPTHLQKCVTAVLDRQLLRHIRRAYNLNSCLQAFATIQPTCSAVTVLIQHSDTSRRSSNRSVAVIDTAHCVKTELNSWTGPLFWGVSGQWYQKRSPRAAWGTPLKCTRPLNWCWSNYRTWPAHCRRFSLFE